MFPWPRGHAVAVRISVCGNRPRTLTASGPSLESRDMHHVEYAYTDGMDGPAVESRLQRAGTGVLALASGDDAYAVPLAHYYDGDRLFFRLGRTPGSTKWEYVDATGTARYVLYGTEATDDPEEIRSWSVLVTGRLRELPERDHGRFDTPEINRRFAPIRVFDEAVEDVEIVVLELEIESMTGRTTPAPVTRE